MSSPQDYKDSAFGFGVFIKRIDKNINYSNIPYLFGSFQEIKDFINKYVPDFSFHQESIEFSSDLCGVYGYPKCIVHIFFTSQDFKNFIGIYKTKDVLNGAKLFIKNKYSLPKLPRKNQVKRLLSFENDKFRQAIYINGLNHKI